VNNPFRENTRSPAPLFYDGAIENQGYERGYEKEEQQRNQQHQMLARPNIFSMCLAIMSARLGAELTRTT
jgi:hypothetical protein